MSPIGLFKAHMGHISLVWSHNAAPQSQNLTRLLETVALEEQG